MRKALLAAVAATLMGCVSSQPDANLTELPRVATTLAANGVPVYQTVEFIRRPTDYERTSACLVRHSGGDGQAVSLDDAVSVNGKSSYYSPKYLKNIEFIFHCKPNRTSANTYSAESPSHPRAICPSLPPTFRPRNRPTE